MNSASGGSSRDKTRRYVWSPSIRLRAHELSETLDRAISNWMHDARQQLAKREDLQLIREHLPVYYDPSRKAPVFGPGDRHGQASGHHGGLMTSNREQPIPRVPMCASDRCADWPLRTAGITARDSRQGTRL